MSAYTTLDNYQIPHDLFIEYIKVYRYIGQNKEFLRQLEEQNNILINKNIEVDTYYLTKYLLKMNLTESRLQLLINKNSLPRSVNEKRVITIKKMVEKMYVGAYDNNLPINSSDILDLLKGFTGKNIKFVTEDFRLQGPNKKSVRYVFNNLLDELDLFSKQEKYESIFLSCIAVMETYNMKPYSECNNLATYILYFYMLLKSQVLAFKYVSFFSIFEQYQKEFDAEIARGSVNYDQGTIFFTGLVRLTLKIILEAYSELLKIINTKTLQRRARKSDYIKKTIMEDLPTIFSKEDVSNLYPDVSLSTIVRVLNELKEKKYIIPLGKGRSAHWQKIVTPDSFEYLIGSDKNDNENNN